MANVKMNMNKVNLEDHIQLLSSKGNLAPKSVQLYLESLHYLNIHSVDTSDVDAVWRNLLTQLKSGKSKTFVLKTISIIKGALRLNGVAVHTSSDLELLECELRTMKLQSKPILGYSEDNIRLLLELIKEDRDHGLFNAVLLMSLAGLMVGALQGLKFSDFHKVPDVEGVRVFKVSSKGQVYTAAISEWAYQEMLLTRFPGQEDVFIYDDGFKSPLTHLLRSRMRYLVGKYSLHGLLKDKSIFHSFRHFFITACASTLDSEEVALLAGHMVSSRVAYRYYINKDKSKVPLEFQKRIAECYSRTTLMNFHLGASK